MRLETFFLKPALLQLFDEHADDIFQYCYRRRITSRDDALLLTERVFAAVLERFDAQAKVAIEDLYELADELIEKLIWHSNSVFRNPIAST